MVNRWLRILSLWAAALLVSMTALAQSSTTGTIEGRVRDQAGNGIAGASVTGIANRSPSAAVTDGQGRYTLANLPPGTYKVRAEAPGKASVVLDDIVVSIGTRSRVDITLVAGQTETVTVTAQAPVVDTKSVTTGGTYKVENFIDQLPGRPQPRSDSDPRAGRRERRRNGRRQLLDLRVVGPGELLHCRWCEHHEHRVWRNRYL